MKSKVAIVLIIFLCVAARATTQSSKSVNATAGIATNTPATTDSMDLKVLCAVGMRQVMLSLVPEFQQATGHRVAITFNSSGEILKWVDSGRPVDIVIIYRSAAEQLAATERVIVGSLRDIAASRVGVAVAKGAPKPDISSLESFKNTMLNAKTIACPDPAMGGASGTYFVRMFKQLGIAEAVKSKLVFSNTPENEKSMPGYLVTTGKAEIALHQMQELLAVPDIGIVGFLPEEIQTRFVFTAAITCNSRHADAAMTLIRFLSTAHAMELIKIKGMEPARE